MSTFTTFLFGLLEVVAHFLASTALLPVRAVLFLLGLPFGQGPRLAGLVTFRYWRDFGRDRGGFARFVTAIAALLTAMVGSLVLLWIVIFVMYFGPTIIWWTFLAVCAVALYWLLASFRWVAQQVTRAQDRQRLVKRAEQQGEDVDTFVDAQAASWAQQAATNQGASDDQADGVAAAVRAARTRARAARAEAELAAAELAHAELVQATEQGLSLDEWRAQHA